MSTLYKIIYISHTQTQATMFKHIPSMYIILYLKEIDLDSILILLAYSRILEQL